MQTNMHTTVAQTKPHFSIPSIIAIGAAIACLFVRPGTGIALAIIAIIFGVIGFILALSPRIRGGVISVFSLLLASIGIIIAIIKAIVGWGHRAMTSGLLPGHHIRVLCG